MRKGLRKQEVLRTHTELGTLVSMAPGLFREYEAGRQETV